MSTRSRRAERSSSSRVLGLAVCLCGLVAAPAGAVTLGVMGDSLSDEYAEASYGSYAENWVEQLAIYGGIDLGPTASQAGQPGGDWGDVRRTGYQYNWALAGADSTTLLSGGQHTGLAAQVGPEGIAYAVLAIGANDFNPSGAAYFSIYNGFWSSAQIDAYVSGRLDNIELALDAVLPTGVRLALVNFPDYGVAPAVRAGYPDPAKRQLVSDVIQQVNAGLDAIAQARQLVRVDLFGAVVAIFGPHASPNATLLLGNVAIDLAGKDTPAGGTPTAGFVDDGIHPNTTLQGILANAFLEGLNVGYGASLPLFSEEDILAHRGLAYGGSDTLVAQMGDYADYVVSYVADCNDGQDNDGDGLADFPDDPGCADAQDLSEHSPLLVCDDGANNDADPWADYPADPGCRDPEWALEDPQCQDGAHNDGDGLMDHDGGASAGAPPELQTAPDPQCAGTPWKNREQGGSCGLGAELVLLLVPLWWLRARRRAGRRC